MGLHDQGLGRKSRQPGLGRTLVCRPGQIQRIVCPADVDSLVAHASQDLASQRVIVRFTSKTESLNEVTLSETMLLKVVCHPPSEARQFGCRGEKVPANRL